MAQGDQNPVNRQGTKIRREKEADSFAKMASGGRIANHQQQQNKQGRHQDSDSPLQATFQSPGNHQDNQRHEDGMPQKQLAGTGQQAAKQLADGVRGATGKVAHGGVADIRSGPATNHRIEREDNERGNHPDDRGDPPARGAEVAFGDQAHAGNGIVPAVPADEHFRHHDGNTDNRDAQQINQHKGATAILAGDIREFPDVAKTNGRTGCRQNKRQPGGPETTSGPCIVTRNRVGLSHVVFLCFWLRKVINRAQPGLLLQDFASTGAAMPALAAGPMNKARTLTVLGEAGSRTNPDALIGAKSGRMLGLCGAAGAHPGI